MDRTVAVDRRRLAGWITRFADRHHGAEVAAAPDLCTLTAPDGAVAAIAVPFPPLLDLHLDGLLAHVNADRVVGVLLARKGGHAVGIFDGKRLTSSKVGSRYVQGKTKAGGWSQQRYARRRANQAAGAYAHAATDTAEVLLPHLERLEHLVTGGDKTAVGEVLADIRLAPLSALRHSSPLPTLSTPDPRLKILQEFASRFLSVRISLNELA